MASARVVSFDTETSGLDWRKNHICGYVLAFSPDPRDSYYLPVRHWESGNLSGMPGPSTATGWDGSLHWVDEEIVRLLDRQGLTVFGHNLAFDLKFMWRVGLNKLRPRFEDTIINAPLLDEHQPKFSLEYCCTQAGVQAKKSAQIVEHIRKIRPEATERNAMGFFWELPGDDAVAVDYATGDGTSTWQLRDWQNLQLAEQELQTVHDIESRLIPVLARMTCRGIRIDEERLRWVAGHIDDEVQRLSGIFPADFNVRSPTDVQKWCQDHGHTDWPLTPKGKPSFPESWLKTHGPGQQIVAVRKLETLKSSFIQPMLETHLWNGRVHTEFNQLRGDEYGTVTGRLSSSNPNLQQVSKHDYEMGKLHRSIFVPDGDKTWASVDYSQIEPRLLAFYSGARVLLDGYRADPPIDAHTAVSSAMNKEWDNLSKEERKKYRDAIGKRINQTLITGGGKGVLVKKYGIPEAEVDEAWNNYFRAMPEIRVLQKRAARRMEQRGYVLSLLGRRARLKDRDKSYTAVNRLLQCGNADIIKAKMVEVDDYLESEGRPIDVLNNVHDSLDFQFDEEHRPVYAESLRIMTDFSEGQLIELNIPMAVDAGEGRNWAEATWGAK